MKKAILFTLITVLLGLQSCRVNYSFSGINISKDIKTFQVDYFPNNASLVVPGLNEDFRNMLIDRIDQQTSLTQVNENGDIIFQGEITDYYVEPVALTAGQTAGQNRLNIKIRIEYINNKDEEENLTKVYSWYYDYPADTSRTDIESEAHEEILSEILDKLFNDTLAKW